MPLGSCAQVFWEAGLGGALLRAGSAPQPCRGSPVGGLPACRPVVTASVLGALGGKDFAEEGKSALVSPTRAP